MSYFREISELQNINIWIFCLDSSLSKVGDIFKNHLRVNSRHFGVVQNCVWTMEHGYCVNLC